MNKVDRIKPMLLSEYREFTNLINKRSRVYVQPKLNGWRAMGDVAKTSLYSRDLNDFDLSHIKADLDKLPNNLKPDGELYSHGLTLREIQSAIRRGDTRVQFHVFDVVSDLPFSSRLETFLRPLKETACIKIVPTFCITPSEIQVYHDKFLAQGYEGLVIRLDGFAYEQGRSERIFKKKPVEMNRLAALFI